jgi:hypothetical protein
LSISWWESAKRWAAEAWADVMAEAPTDPAEVEALARARVGEYVREATSEASAADLSELTRFLCAVRETLDEGLETRGGDRLLVMLGANGIGRRTAAEQANAARGTR